MSSFLKSRMKDQAYLPFSHRKKLTMDEQFRIDNSDFPIPEQEEEMKKINWLKIVLEVVKLVLAALAGSQLPM